MIHTGLHNITRIEFSKIRQFESSGRTCYSRDLVFYMEGDYTGPISHKLNLYADDREALDIYDSKVLLQAVLA